METVFVDSSVINYAVIEDTDKNYKYRDCLFARALFQSFKENRNKGYFPFYVQDEVNKIPNEIKRDKMLELLSIMNILDYEPMIDKITDKLIELKVHDEEHRVDLNQTAYSFFYGLDYLASYNYNILKIEVMLERYSSIDVEGIVFNNNILIVEPEKVSGVLVKIHEWWRKAKYETSRRLNIEAYKRGAISKENLDKVISEIDFILNEAVFVE
jgi:hypothetical protein